MAPRIPAAQRDGELFTQAVAAQPQGQRIDVLGAGAGREDAVVFELRIPAGRDVSGRIAQRALRALLHVVLDDGGARARYGLDDDPWMRDLIHALGGRHVQDDQGSLHLARHLEIQAVLKERGVDESPA